MPPVIQFFTIGVTVSAAAYPLVAALAATWNAFLVSTVINAAARALSGRPKGTIERPAARDITVTGGAEPGVIVLGYTRVSGVVLFIGSSGDRNQYLHWVLAGARHQCEDIDAYWLDEDQILATSLNGDGDVTSGKYANKVRIRKYLGADAQTASTELESAFGEWTTNHRGRGVCYVHIRLETDEELFPNGNHPRNFYFRVKGVRAYDPRLDSTNGGSGSHRYTDPTTWAWTQNAALLQIFYLMGGSLVFDTNNAALQGHLGFGVDPIDIDWPSVIAAANICDENVTIPPASPTTTQDRYTLNGVLSTANSLADNMEQLLTASIGQLVYTGAKYVLYAGAYETPTLTALDSDDLAGSVELVKDTPRDRRYNAVRGTYFSNQTWQEAEFVPKTNAAFETRDAGERLWRDIVLPFTDDGYRAQRIATVHLNQSDNMRIVKWAGQLSCFKVPAWGIVPIELPELSLSNAPHRCIGWEFDEQGLVNLELREESSVAYVDPAVADYGSIAIATPDTNQDDSLPAPTNLRATAGRNGFLLEWDAPTPAPPGITYEVFEFTSATPFSSATRLHRTAQTSIWTAKTDITQRFYWVRSRLNNVVSAEAPTGSGVPAKAAVIDTNPNVSLSPTSLTTPGNTTPLTSASCGASASGGTPPYTYAWARISGSTDITANSPTGSSTTFNGANLTPGENIEAIFRCTVTDSLSATATADVSVRFERAAFSVSANNCNGVDSGAPLSGNVQTGEGGGVASPSTTPNNGVGSFTYSWAHLSTLSGTTPTISSSTAQNPTWNTTVSDGVESFSNWRVTVTDLGNGSATATKDITVQLIWNSTS